MLRLRRLLWGDEEELVHTLQVRKTDVNKKEQEKKEKKFKRSFLCITTTTASVAGPAQARLYLVKQTAAAAATKTRTWTLKELEAVDGGGEETEIFSLTFEGMQYDWLAPSAAEKAFFLAKLLQIRRIYVAGAGPNVVNVAEIDVEQAVVETKVIEPEDDLDDEDLEDETRTLTAEEEDDVEAVLAAFGGTNSDTRVLSERLQDELELLESANVQAILESEMEVRVLMSELDEAINAVFALEDLLDNYDSIIKPIRRDATRAFDQEHMLRVQLDNHQKLEHEVATLVERVSMPYSVVDVLEKSSLSTTKGVQECQVAAMTLLKTVEELDKSAAKGWDYLDLVVKKKKEYREFLETFCLRLRDHLRKLIAKQAASRAQTVKITSIHLPEHRGRHGELTPYTELLSWLRRADRVTKGSKYEDVLKEYFTVMREMYTTELLGLVEYIKSTHPVPKSKDRNSKESPQRRREFAMTFQKVIEVLVPTILAEQKFCHSFFGLAPVVAAAPPPPGEAKDAAGSEEAGPAPKKAEDSLSATNSHVKELRERLGTSGAASPKLGRKAPNPPEGGPKRTAPNAPGAQQNAAAAVAAAANVLADLMGKVFGGVPDFVKELVELGNNVDPFLSFIMFVTLDVTSQRAQIESPYIFRTLGTCIITAKRHLDAYVNEREKEIFEFNNRKKDPPPLLPFVSQFTEMVHQIETLAPMPAERRPDIDKAYKRLGKAVVDTIQAVAEHAKNPQVMMFENFHRFYDEISQLKLDALKEYRTVAHEKYREHLGAYVRGVLGRPLEHLSTFFEGVERLIGNGTPASDVGFNHDYRRSELKDVIAEYPIKKVRKGLEATYKGVVKQINLENLLVVVWRSIQEEFVKLIHRMDELMAECYPGMQLEFNEASLLEIFTDIAAAQGAH